VAVTPISISPFPDQRPLQLIEVGNHANSFVPGRDEQQQVLVLEGCGDGPAHGGVDGELVVLAGERHQVF